MYIYIYKYMNKIYTQHCIKKYVCCIQSNKSQLDSSPIRKKTYFKEPVSFGKYQDTGQVS